MRLNNQHASDDYDEHCAGCEDDSNHQPSIFSDGHVSFAHHDYTKLLASVGGLTVVTNLAVLLTGLTRVFKRSYTGPVYSDGIYLVDSDGECIGENALGGGEKVTVFPEPRPGIEKASTLLVRHMEDIYGGTTSLEYMVSGYAAYSKICTHAGCMMSNEDGATLACPYHFDKFDPTTGAKVVGRPPSRALPQLSIALSNEGNLIMMGDFDGPVGPEGE